MNAILESDRFNFKMTAEDLVIAIQKHLDNNNSELALQKTYELQRNVAIMSELDRRVKEDAVLV